MNRQALAADSATKKLLIEFLLQMNDLARSDCTVVVVAATNCDPVLLDPAFVRRFEKKIFVPLPSPTERIEMMRANLHEIEHSIGDQDFQVLAKLTSGYRCGRYIPVLFSFTAGDVHCSGSDLRALVRDAAMIPVREFTAALTHGDANDGADMTIERERRSGPVGRLGKRARLSSDCVRPVSRADFEHAVSLTYQCRSAEE